MRRLRFDDPRLSRAYERDLAPEDDIREKAHELVKAALAEDPDGHAWGRPPSVEEALRYVTVGQGETVA